MTKSNYLEKLLNGAKVEWKKLGEIGIVSGAGVDKKKNKTEKPIKLLNYMDIYKNRYLDNKIPSMVVTATDKKIEQCNVLKGDIFFTPSSEVLNDIGKSAVVLENMEGVVYSYHIMRLRLNNPNIITSMFINHIFSSDLVQKQINKKAKGITRFGLTKTQWEKIQVPLPPLPVQQEIVRILDTFTELKTELKTELTARKKQYEYYRDKLLTPIEDNGKWFLNGKEVEWKKLGEVCKVFTGGEPPANLIKGENPTSICKYPIFGNGAEVYGYTDTYRIDKDAVTISSIGANTGTIYFRKAFFTPIIRLKVVLPIKENLLSKYLFYYLSSINIYSKKSSVPNMNANDVKKIKIPIPPLEEQERIVSILDKFDTLTNSITEGLPREIELRQKQYEYYRDLLLSFPKEED
ncbi:restriction endonuclease subunit S [Methanohalophilus sp.]|uniref:restriction endonuclease subunit S n=1 Tax=Methanohalophilus sp. TaxID=1966352 RepID=UPI00261C3F64|nr:restriction endonuclease subunit S [Methanohalophilus sp.]MDK2891857.1 type restriction enzyme subunit [Methanohalophilus sp.]